MSAPISNNIGFTSEVECAFNAYLNALYGKALINSEKRAKFHNFLCHLNEKIISNTKED